MNGSIPATKSKSKIKPLEEKIRALEYENETLLEECYKNGTRTRPTIMTQIEKKEAETKKHIEYYIRDCERVTGRSFFMVFDS
jgi:hypothetical protein